MCIKSENVTEQPEIEMNGPTMRIIHNSDNNEL